jgi:hypothetical protein
MGIGGFAGVWAVAAAGGAVVTTIGATIVRGEIGAGLGGLLLLSMAAGIRVNLAAAAVVVWPWERRHGCQIQDLLQQEYGFAARDLQPSKSNGDEPSL